MFVSEIVMSFFKLCINNHNVSSQGNEMFPLLVIRNLHFNKLLKLIECDTTIISPVNSILSNIQLEKELIVRCLSSDFHMTVSTLKDMI